MPQLDGKFGIVFGVANKRSLAWAIARALDASGARLALTYQGDRFEKGVRDLASGLRDPLVLPCDVSRDADLDAVFERVRSSFGGLDLAVHAVAFARPGELEKRYLATSREGFALAHDVSVYSLTAIARRAAPLMEGRGGSIVTLTYLGGERVVPNYNVMGVAKAALESSVRYLAADLGPGGVRVNAISAGPVRTLSSAGVSGFVGILDRVAQTAPLRRNVEPEEIADAAVFLLSSASRGITGEVIHVDCGFHVLGV
ncbi:MAG TPA: enoyl-ACP reductase [Planctomycetota bacterium]|jgi:enoyl-[acyl-carrier protein] reductase I|nr:enoyl-ACP reductase [Planctomycetota bacterium]